PAATASAAAARGSRRAGRRVGCLRPGGCPRPARPARRRTCRRDLLTSSGASPAWSHGDAAGRGATGLRTARCGDTRNGPGACRALAEPGGVSPPSRAVPLRCIGVAAAAVLLPLGLGGCASGLHAVRGGHGALLRIGTGRCKPGPPLAGVYLPFRLHVK